ncbi:MAG: GNAT family N-acetyltransferase [Kouleothrix sp.]
MTHAIAIQPFIPSDAAYIALAVIGASTPPQYALDYEFRDADDWRAFDASFAEAGRALTRYVATLPDGTIVGYGYWFEASWALPAGRGWCIIRVLPTYLRQGIGNALYTRLLGDLINQGMAAMLLEVDDTLADLHPALARRGFRELLHSWAFTLDPRTCDPARFSTAYQKLGSLTITTLAAEIARGAEWLPQLHQLYTLVAGDVPIPIHPHADAPPSWLAQQAVGLPESLPDGFFIVRDGPRYVGMSFLHAGPPGMHRLYQRITAIDPTYRGRGIAMALKLETIAYARAHSYHEIRTAVESNNPSMLAINTKLGFEAREGLALMIKPL